MKIKFGLLLIVSFLLTGCNGENQQPTAPHYSTSVSGKVIDDPLSNAKVCFDINNNMHCDKEEPATYSQAGGEYYFAEIPIHVTTSIPLLAEITIDTINEYTGLPVDKAYKMKSYIGCTNVITPYTSMIQHLIEQQYSTEEAERKVKHKVMTNLPLCSDYISQGSSDKLNNYQKEEYVHLHKMANIFTGFMASNMKRLSSDPESNSNLAYQDLHSIITHHQMNNLDAVINDLNNITLEDEVENTSPTKASSSQVPSTGGFFNSLSSSLDLSKIAMTLDLASRNLEEEAAIMESMKNSREYNLLKHFAKAESKVGGLYYYDEQNNDGSKLSYTTQHVNRTVNENDPRIGYNLTYSYEEKIWNSNTEDFEINNQFRSNLKILLSNGFSPVLNYALLYGKNRKDQEWGHIFFDYYYDNNGPYDNQARLIHSVGSGDFSTRREQNESYILTARSYDISNRKIRSLLSLQDRVGPWNKALNPNKYFQGSSRAYMVTTKAATRFTLLNQALHVPVLVPSIDLVTNIEAENEVRYSYQENNIELNQLRPQHITRVVYPPYTFTYSAESNLTYMPILFQTHDTYIAVKLNPERATFYQISKNDLANPLRIDINSTFIGLDGDGRYPNEIILTGKDIGVGTWRSASDNIEITIPPAVRRLGVNLNISNTVAIASIQGILRLGRVYKEGDTVYENVLGVPYPTHQQIINGIDREKVRE